MSGRDEIRPAARGRKNAGSDTAEIEAILDRMQLRKEELRRQKEKLLGETVAYPAAAEKPVKPEPDQGVTSEQILENARREADRIIAEARVEAEAIKKAALQEISLSDREENAVFCVESCISGLRELQEESIEFLNLQWQSFLCGLVISEEPSQDGDNDEA